MKYYYGLLAQSGVGKAAKSVAVYFTLKIVFWHYKQNLKINLLILKSIVNVLSVKSICRFKKLLLMAAACKFIYAG